MLRNELASSLKMDPPAKKGASTSFVWLWSSLGILTLLCLSPAAFDLYLSGLGLPLALGLLIGLTALTISMRSFSSLSTKNLFIVFYTIYYTIPAIIAVVNPQSNAQLSRWNVTASPALLHLIALAALGLVAFIAGYRLRLGTSLGKRITVFVQNQERRVDLDVVRRLLILAVVPIALAFTQQLGDAGGLGALITLDYLEVLDIALGWVQRGVAWIPPLLICLALIAQTSQRPARRVTLTICIALLALGVAAALASQSRVRGLWPLLGVLLLIHYQIKPLSKRTLILLGLLALVIANVFALVRGGQFSVETVREVFQSAQYIETQQQLLLGEGPGLFGLNYMIVESILEGHQPLLGGQTQLAALVRWLPDTLAFGLYDLLGVEQFHGIAVWIVLTYFPSLYAGPRIGFATLVLIEPYVNFGWLGVIASLVGTGFLSKTVDTILEEGKSSPLAQTIGIIAATETLFWVRGGSLILRQLLYALLPLIMVYLAAIFISRKRHRASRGRIRT